MKRNVASIYFTGRILAGLMLLCGLASANPTILATGVDWNRGASFWMNGDGQDFQAYFGGVINITLADNGVQYFRDTLCVDLFTDIFLGQTNGTTVLTPYDVPGKNLPRVAWLLDNALVPTQGPVDPSNPPSLPPADWVTSSAQGAGLQFAIWDIVHDAGDGFSAGRVQASTDPNNPTDATILFWAQFYEAASVNQAAYNAYIYNNVDLGNGAPAQMLAGPQFLDGGPSPAPEPPTFALAGAALIGVGQYLRKRTRRQVTTG
jgi:hypothetical protein